MFVVNLSALWDWKVLVFPAHIRAPQCDSSEKVLSLEDKYCIGLAASFPQSGTWSDVASTSRETASFVVQVVWFCRTERAISLEPKWTKFPRNRDVVSLSPWSTAGNSTVVILRPTGILSWATGGNTTA